MLKKILIFIWINIASLSVFYTIFNFPVLIERVKGDISDLISPSSVEAHENNSEAIFYLDTNTWSNNTELSSNYENFPGKSTLEWFVNYMDERKSEVIGSWQVVKTTNKKEKKNDGLIIIEDKKEKRKNILDISKPLSPEEQEKYWNDSWIVIPKLKVEAPINYPSVEEYDLEGVIIKLLEKWVAHRPETQLPDQSWNFFVIGHSSNLPWIKSKYNNIFASIWRLKEGDIVKVYYKWRVLTYKMYTSFIVPPEAVDVYWYIPWYNLTLMTCWPVWTDKDRLIVRFSLEY